MPSSKSFSSFAQFGRDVVRLSIDFPDERSPYRQGRPAVMIRVHMDEVTDKERTIEFVLSLEKVQDLKKRLSRWITRQEQIDQAEVVASLQMEVLEQKKHRRKAELS